MSEAKRILCPSAPPDADGAVAFGVVGRRGNRSHVRWIETPQPVTPELLDKTGEADPRQVMRFAGACQEKACAHFDGKDCQLATRLVSMLDPVAGKPPPCTLRKDCRWFTQEGVAACRRCPQIVTQTGDPDKRMREAATPPRARSPQTAADR